MMAFAPPSSPQGKTDGLRPLPPQGLLSMANSGPDSNSAHFSIVVAPSPHLDGHYAIFGEVLSGMDVSVTCMHGAANARMGWCCMRMPGHYSMPRSGCAATVHCSVHQSAGVNARLMRHLNCVGCPRAYASLTLFFYCCPIVLPVKSANMVASSSSCTGGAQGECACEGQAGPSGGP